METLFLPTENEIKSWIKEAIKEYFDNSSMNATSDSMTMEPFLSRKEIADFLNISLVTLHDWKKRGMPSHKQRGRVYFMRSEVLAYIKTNELA